MTKTALLLSAASLWLSAAAQLPREEFRVAVVAAHEKVDTGKYAPTWESLSQYEMPEWFRDAKFGIWAHWGPQCVEGSGDWMARDMYREGTEAYRYHCDHYGHPSETGFKDILPLFKAERWEPEKLVDFYKEVGARYFFVLGNHHDNFDLWDSKYQEWNSMRIGPERDLIDGWAKAARKAGLPLGISLHADHAWRFYEPSQFYDTKGDKAGLPYDGNLTRRDGKGKWWEGLDPQDLYAQNHPLSEKSRDGNSIHYQWDWNNGCALPSQSFVANFQDRTLDVINRYAPDLLYFDTTVLPFYGISDCGLNIAAHFYNHNPKNHDGRQHAVLFGKILDENQRKTITWDVERGAPNEIIPDAWQTCTCLGGWHWNERISRENRYKKAPQVVKMLADVVSKNGNLLLNVPLRADGTFDDHERHILEEIGAWMRQNGEAIYNTRPWAKFGEGPVAEQKIGMNRQGFNEGSYANMDSRDIRFTQRPGKKGALYAIALGWPADGRLLIKSLSKDNPFRSKRISKAELLGHGSVECRQTEEGLLVVLPEKPVNSIAPVVKIRN